MQLRFASNKLRRCYESQTEAQKRWPGQLAQKFVLRINMIQIATSFHDLQQLPALNIHQLKGRRKEQWSMKLDERWRLIFLLEYSDGVEAIQVLEVSNHYGD